ncbi:MAG: hypothetical protein V3W41_21295 [Planctomycetota bacterium]
MRPTRLDCDLGAYGHFVLLSNNSGESWEVHDANDPREKPRTSTTLIGAIEQLSLAADREIGFHENLVDLRCAIVEKMAAIEDCVSSISFSLESQRRSYSEAEQF